MQPDSHCPRRCRHTRSKTVAEPCTKTMHGPQDLCKTVNAITVQSGTFRRSFLAKLTCVKKLTVHHLLFQIPKQCMTWYFEKNHYTLSHVLQIRTFSVSSIIVQHDCAQVLYSCTGIVSCPDPTLSRGKGSGDHWAIPWLCRVSSLDTEQPNEIVLRHATVLDWPTYL